MMMVMVVSMLLDRKRFLTSEEIVVDAVSVGVEDCDRD